MYVELVYSLSSSAIWNLEYGRLRLRKVTVVGAIEVDGRWIDCCTSERKSKPIVDQEQVNTFITEIYSLSHGVVCVCRQTVLGVYIPPEIVCVHSQCEL